MPFLTELLDPSLKFDFQGAYVPRRAQSVDKPTNRIVKRYPIALVQGEPTDIRRENNLSKVRGGDGRDEG